MNKRLSLIPRELIAFAFVSDEYSKTGDIARGLMPLFTPILAKQPNKTFDPNWFSNEVESTYDIPMRALVAEGLVGRLADIGLLYQESKDSNVYKISPNQDTSAPLNNQEFDDLIREFVDFANKNLKAANLEISEEIIESALLKRFTSLQFLSLLERPDKNYYKGNTISLKKSPDEISENIDQDQLLDVICANFALYLLEAKREKFDLLTKIASGALIAEVVLTLQTPAPNEKLTNVTLLFDGPLLLDYLDLSTIELRDFSKSLFELTDKLQLKKAILDHTVTEMKGTIYAPLESLQRGQLPFGPLGDRIRNDVQHAAYARSIYDGLEDKLKELDIEIIDSTNYTQDVHLEFCSKDIEDGLINNLGKPHENLERRIKDAKSVATVLRMRGKKSLHPQSITDANYLLTTRNDAVAKRSRSYLIFRKQIDDRDFPPCLTDRQLAGLLWFAAGGSLAALSSKKLIANCSYVMHPRNDIVSKMRQCLTDIKPEQAEIFTVLMRDQRAQRCFVQATFGFPSIITTDNAEQLLEAIKSATAAEILQEALESEDKLKQTHEEKLHNLNSIYRDEIFERETQITNLTNQQKNLEVDLETQSKNHNESMQDLTKKINSIQEIYASDIDKRIFKAAEIASTQHKRLTVMIILWYALFVTLIFMYGPSSLLLQAAINIPIAILGFWIVPEMLFKPLGDYVWKGTFFKQIEIMNLSDNLNLYNIEISNRKVSKLIT